MTWNEEVQIHKNYSPSELDSLDVSANGRVIRLQPLNWTDRDIWIAGLTVLLRRSKTNSLTKEVVTEVVQNKIRQETQSCAESRTSSLGRSSHGVKSHQSSPRKSITHRRSMTIIANEEITPTSSRFTFNAL